MEQAYMTAAEAAKKWGISDRRVRLLCSSGKIEGIVRTGRSYQIPREAVKPADERTLRQKDIPAEYKSLFRRIDGKRDELIRRLREGGFCLEESHKEFLIEWIENSLANTGNDLSAEEIRTILNGYPAEGRPLRKQLEVLGLQDAFEWIRELAFGARLSESQLSEPQFPESQLSEPLLLKLHGLVLMDRRREGGRYRTRLVQIPGTEDESPQPFMVPVMLDWLFREYAEKKKKLHALETIPRLYMDFQWIHPFSDGNTRVGWILANLELMRAGYLPVTVGADQTEEYYQGLKSYYGGKGEAPMIRLVAGLEEKELDRRLKETER